MTSSYVNGTTTTYLYRGDGLRKSKSTNGVTTNHVWDGDQIVQDLDGYDVSREYVRGLRLIDTHTPGTPERMAYIQNARGDVVGHINTLTTAIDFVDYDAYGNFESSAPSDPLAYCGEYLDSETGFIYLRARYYDPNLGRFTTEDPARDGLNWYVYCNNNPIAFVDPSGMWTIALGGDLSAAFLLKLGISGQIVIDDNKNVGILLSGSAGVGTPSVGASATLSYTSADTIKDLTGVGFNAGVSACLFPAWPGLGVQYTGNGSDVHGITISFDWDAKPWAEGHADVSWTYLLPLYGELANTLYDKVQEFVDSLTEELPKELQEELEEITGSSNS